MSIFEYDEEGVMDVMREEGREEGRADATLKDIRNIMTKLNKSADEAMDILDVPFIPVLFIIICTQSFFDFY